MPDSFIDIDVGDAVELSALEEGEYNVVVRDAENDESDNGEYTILRLEVPDEMDSKTITHVMMWPQPDDDPKRENNRKLALKRACEAFGVDYEGGFDVKEFTNKEARAYLTVEESEEYGRQNNVRRWVSGPSDNGENRSEDLAI